MQVRGRELHAQPGLESPDIAAAFCFGGPHKIVGDGLNFEPGVIERRDKCAPFQLVGGEKLALQDHSKAFDSRVYGHGGSIEPKFVTCLNIRADDLSQIVSPGQRIGGMNQGSAAEIVWFPKLNLLDQSRTA
jgi:hypothetical protein